MTNQYSNEPISIEDYLLEKTDRTTDCWIWKTKAKVIATRRCGDFYFSKSPSIVAWELRYGKKPDKRINPRCGNYLCINPEHQQEYTRTGRKSLHKTKNLPIIKIESKVFWKLDSLGEIDWHNQGVPVYEGKKVVVA